ncbi:unnamed protein product [Macrosiphum euphorbiae]|uniref:DUF4371 domain-containing protein n=1 Tax=Macrosiphum euphorbiae TaxID=13131 RepID=A0AAV0W6C4_9HEMI|nr:unnamed protein product [Macrosiphum euphorbiae]
MPVKCNEYEAYCKYCKQTLKTEITVLKLHALGKKHKSIMLSGHKKQPPVSLFTTETDSDMKKKQLVSIAKIKLAAYFAEHNVPFLGADHLSELLTKVFPDSEIAKNINVNRTKTTAIIKNVIGSSQKFILSEKLKKQKFSLMTDESTDIGTIKTSCVVARFYDESSEMIASVFWQLHNVYDTDNPSSASAEHLYNDLISTLNEYEIPLTNIIGFGSDGCNVMMGQHNSVVSRLRESCPGIFIMKCVCHSAHLCASEACKQLPHKYFQFSKE